MRTIIETDVEALRSTLRAARQNAERWMEMYQESTADNERMEQWISIAKLRRREVERIESLLAQVAEHRGSPQATGHETAAACNEQANRP